MTMETAAAGDYLNMSDAEIMNAPEPVAVATEVVEETPAPEPEVVTEVQETEPGNTDNDDEQETSTDNEEDVAEGGTEAVETSAETEKPEATEKVESVIDYKAEYERLFAPFKANGREVKVDSVEDAKTLMQMGANYNKKMAALKPSLKILKLLENNGLLSEEKISFLIDVEKKNPEAINKLVKDSGLDPMDLDAEKAGEYKPKIHTVNDVEIELDTVLDEIQDTPTYTQTLDIVSSKWDGASKQTVANSPQLLKVINDHVASGIYDLINEEVEKHRVLGRLNGLSDIEAYRQVGDSIQARGGFNHLVQGQKETPPAPVVVAPKPKQAIDDKLNEKRRAASSTKPANASPASASSDLNPLSLSDEEFSKLASLRFR